jgi:hypothetical protein
MTAAPNLDLDAILDGRTPRPKTLRMVLPRDVQAARTAEIKLRNGLAFNMARQAIVLLHRDDYLALLTQAKAKVNAERGPLPGDEAS